MQDFARVQDKVIRGGKRAQKDLEILQGNFYKATTGSLVNMKGDFRAGSSDIYIPNILSPEPSPFGSSVSLSVDSYADANVRPNLSCILKVFQSCPFTSRRLTPSSTSCATTPSMEQSQPLELSLS